jgi:hypothetical protein
MEWWNITHDYLSREPSPLALYTLGTLIAGFRYMSPRKTQP